jgi:hypothetical protein
MHIRGATGTNAVPVLIEREVPTEVADAVSWSTVELESVRASETNSAPASPSLKPLSIKFLPRFLDGIRLEVSNNRQWRTDQSWPEHEMRVQTLSGVRVIMVGSKTLFVVYVLPSHPEATDLNNDGNNPTVPRKTLPDMNGTVPPPKSLITFAGIALILESGYIHAASNGWNGPESTSFPVVIQSSLPGRAAFLSGFAEQVTNIAASWVAQPDGTYETTAAQLGSVSDPNLVVFDPPVAFDDPNATGTQLCEYRPMMVVYSNSISAPQSQILWRPVESAIRYRPPAAAAGSSQSAPILAFVNSASVPVSEGRRATVSFKSINTPFEVWCRDIEFWGGAIPCEVIGGTGAPIEAHFFRCGFRFSADKTSGSGLSGSDCLTISNDVRLYLHECDVTDGCADGLDVRGEGVPRPQILEDRCVMKAVGNVPDFANNMQGSTYHYGVDGLRVGCEYGITGGPNIQDVSTKDDSASGCFSAMLGCSTYLALKNSRCGVEMGLPSPDKYYSVVWLFDHRFASPFGEFSLPLGRRVKLSLDAGANVPAGYSVGTMGNVDVLAAGGAGTVFKSRTLI